MMCFEVTGMLNNPKVIYIFPLQAVTALVKNYPRHMVSSMQQILPIVWNTLTESAALYPFYSI